MCRCVTPHICWSIRRHFGRSLEAKDKKDLGVLVAWGIIDKTELHWPTYISSPCIRLVRTLQ